jgi:hypothetical protein
VLWSLQDTIAHTSLWVDHDVTFPDNASALSSPAARAAAVWSHATTLHASLHAPSSPQCLPQAAWQNGASFMPGMRLLFTRIARDVLWYDAHGSRFASVCLSNLGDMSGRIAGPMAPPPLSEVKSDGERKAETAAKSGTSLSPSSPFRPVDWYGAQIQNVAGQDVFLAVGTAHGVMTLCYTYTRPLLSEQNIRALAKNVRQLIDECSRHAIVSK